MMLDRRALAIAVLALAACKDSARGSFAVLCDAPRRADLGRIAPAEREARLAQWVKTNLPDGAARKLFTAISFAAPEDRGQLLRDAAAGEGVKTCALADWIEREAVGFAVELGVPEVAAADAAAAPPGIVVILRDGAIVVDGEPLPRELDARTKVLTVLRARLDAAPVLVAAPSATSATDVITALTVLAAPDARLLVRVGAEVRALPVKGLERDPAVLARLAPSATHAQLVAAILAARQHAATDPAAPPAAITPPLALGVRGVQVIDLEYGGYTSYGLPAIRADGSALVVLSTASDGDRGYLGLTALVLDGTTGAVTRTLPLTTPDTTAAAIGADDDRPGAGQLATAEAATAAAVAELNALVAADWRPLVSTRRDPGAGPPAPREAITAGPLTFTFVARDRTLVVNRAGDLVATHTFPPVPIADPCTVGATFLAAVHTDAPTRRAVIQLDHAALGDGCIGAPSIYAVIPLP